MRRRGRYKTGTVSQEGGVKDADRELYPTSFPALRSKIPASTRRVWVADAAGDGFGNGYGVVEHLSC